MDDLRQAIEETITHLRRRGGTDNKRQAEVLERAWLDFSAEQDTRPLSIPSPNGTPQS